MPPLVMTTATRVPTCGRCGNPLNSFYFCIHCNISHSPGPLGVITYRTEWEEQSWYDYRHAAIQYAREMRSKYKGAEVRWNQELL